MMDLLSKLNPAQRKACEINDRNVLIVAGAGSGKTRVLTYKIAYLLKEKGLKPNEILAMTFSNRAAKEMKDRVASLLEPNLVPRWVGTFHSMCVRIIREFLSETDLKDNFTIYDEEEQASVIKESLESLNLTDKKYKPRGLVELFSRCKNQNIGENLYFAELNDKVNLANIFESYSALLKRNNALDFGSILLEALKLLQKPNIREILHKRWKFILIDEYQDTNKVQRELLKNLKSDGNLVCAVGDDDQSIYRWRGATIENILSFPEDFQNSEVVKLEKNYRSTKRILDCANLLIMNNSQRMGKTLYTDNEKGDAIEYYQSSDEKDEAAFICSKIDAIIRRGILQLSDIAVFYRTHAQSRVIEEALVTRSIPYKIVGGTRFYDRKEIKDVIAYLKFLNNKSDFVSLKRIINLPPRGIGKKTIQILESFASQKNMAPYEILDKKIPFGGKSHLKFLPLVEMIKHLDTLKDLSLHDFAMNVIQLSGYQKMLQEDSSYESEIRLDNVRELLSAIKDYENINPKATLNSWLENVSLVNESDEYESLNNYVTLMTVHCSKGLEFKTVFVAGLEDGLFPHQNSLDEFAELEEERRLFYVAMTRAMKKLYLSNAFQRRFYATKTYKMPSRFLDEIKESIEAIGYSTMHRHIPKKASRGSESSYFSDYIPDYEDESPYKRGMKVRHPEFGDGIIKKCEKSGDHYRLTIDFRLFGVKKIVPEYAKLETV